LIAAILCIGCLAAAPATAPQHGVFALRDGTPQERSLLTVHPTSTGQNQLDIVQYPIGSTRPVTQYDPDMTQLMHLVIVRDDFRKFMHVHPVLHADGHFTVPVALDEGHRFYAYADTTPRGGSQQVFRFVLQSGVQPRKLDTTVAASSPTIAAGPYAVTLQATRIRANQGRMMPATITRGGRLATNLHPYLGAAAHAVFINTSSLDYVHVHPMQRGAMGRLALMIPALPRGTYKMWLEFRGGSSLYVAPFTIVAR
jgi:hypothetical protein